MSKVKLTALQTVGYSLAKR